MIDEPIFDVDLHFNNHVKFELYRRLLDLERSYVKEKLKHGSRFGRRLMKMNDPRESAVDELGYGKMNLILTGGLTNVLPFWATKRGLSPLLLITSSPLASHQTKDVLKTKLGIASDVWVGDVFESLEQTSSQVIITTQGFLQQMMTVLPVEKLEDVFTDIKTVILSDLSRFSLLQGSILFHHLRMMAPRQIIAITRNYGCLHQFGEEMRKINSMDWKILFNELFPPTDLYYLVQEGMGHHELVMWLATLVEEGGTTLVFAKSHAKGKNLAAKVKKTLQRSSNPEISSRPEKFVLFLHFESSTLLDQALNRNKKKQPMIYVLVGSPPPSVTMEHVDLVVHYGLPKSREEFLERDELLAGIFKSIPMVVVPTQYEERLIINRHIFPYYLSGNFDTPNWVSPSTNPYLRVIMREGTKKQANGHSKMQRILGSRRLLPTICKDGSVEYVHQRIHEIDLVTRFVPGSLHSYNGVVQEVESVYTNSDGSFLPIFRMIEDETTIDMYHNSNLRSFPKLAIKPYHKREMGDGWVDVYPLSLEWSYYSKTKRRVIRRKTIDVEVKPLNLWGAFVRFPYHGSPSGVIMVVHCLSHALRIILDARYKDLIYGFNPERGSNEVILLEPWSPGLLAGLPVNQVIAVTMKILEHYLRNKRMSLKSNEWKKIPFDPPVIPTARFVTEDGYETFGYEVLGYVSTLKKLLTQYQEEKKSKVLPKASSTQSSHKQIGEPVGSG